MACLFLGALAAVGAETNLPSPEIMGPPLPPPPLVASPSPPPRVMTNAVDRAWTRVSVHLLDMADSLDQYLDRLLTRKSEEHSLMFDRFYGDRRMLNEHSSSSIRVSPYVVFSEDSPRTSVRVRARLDLPRFEDRAKIVFDNMTDDRDPLTEVRTFSSRDPTTPDENDRSLSLRYRVLDSARYDMDADGGLRLDPEPVVQFRTRGRMRWYRERSTVTLSETGFWEQDDGFGERTQLEYSRPLDENHAFKLKHTAVWSEESQGVDLGATVGLATRLSARRTLTLTGGAGWHTHPDALVDEYVVRLTYRQLVYRDWMFVEVEPGLDFQNEEHWETEPLVTLRLDVLFGKP